jgi:hypothetical protein
MLGYVNRLHGARERLLDNLGNTGRRHPNLDGGISAMHPLLAIRARGPTGPLA